MSEISPQTLSSIWLILIAMTRILVGALFGFRKKPIASYQRNAERFSVSPMVLRRKSSWNHLTCMPQCLDATTRRRTAVMLNLRKILRFLLKEFEFVIFEIKTWW